MIVYCSVPNESVAQEISRSIVEEGLCACVTQIPRVKSYYIYEGEFCEDDEHLLMIKTASTHYKALEQRLNELHPYDVPEIICTPIIESSPAYHAWLIAALK